MNILAIDPSTTCLGWAFSVGNNPPSHGILKPQGVRAGGLSVEGQVPSLPWDNATHLFIEMPLFNSKHKNANTIRVTWNLYGFIRGYAEANALCVYPVSPQEWRKVCGIKGGDRESKKAGAITFVKRLYGIDSATSDEAEALCILHYARSVHYKT